MLQQRLQSMQYVFILFLFLLITFDVLGATNTCLTQLGGLQNSFESAQELKKIILNGQSVKGNALISESLINIKAGVFSLASSGLVSKSFLRKKSASILDQMDKSEMTYQEYLELSYDAVAFFELVNQVASRTLYRTMSEGFETNRQLIYKVTTDKIQDGILNLPISRELSYEEMNNLWMMGMRPLGIVARPTIADLSLRGPLNYFNHDGNHALSLHNVLPSALTKTLYYKIKREIARFDPYTRDAIERIIFYAVHEVGQNLESRRDVALIFARGIGPEYINTKKLSKKTIKEVADFMMGRPSESFVTAIDFVRDLDGKITSKNWEDALSYLYE